jgi:ATP-binding cassette, subfamily B, bacterial
MATTRRSQVPDVLTERIASVRAMVALPFRAAPGMAAGQSMIMIAQALVGPAQAFGVRALIDSVSGTGSAALGFGLILGGSCASLLFQVAGTALWATLNERMDAYIQQRILKSTTAVPHVGHHERPDLTDRIGMIRGSLMELQNSVTFVVNGINMLVSGIAVLAVLTSVSPLLLLLVVMAGLRVWAAGRSARWGVAAAERVQSKTRLAGQLEDIAASPQHATEVRVSGLSSVLLQRILRLQEQARRETERAAVRGLVLRLVIGLGYGLAYGGVLIFVMYRAIGGHATVGDVALVLLLSVQIESLAQNVAGQAEGMAATLRVVDHLTWLTLYSRAEQVSTAARQAPSALEHGIELCHVSFTYPGTGTETLHDISLRLPAGSVVALVGENGAGKSTLVKLLCGLYSPTAGEILVDGRPVHGLAPGSWRARITVVFQDAVRYSLPVSDAVGIGFLPQRDDEQAVRNALRRAGGEELASALPQGLATQLGKGFTGGVDLSGGQWQRLALARSAMREDPLLRVLDEPTSAIDPETERALVRQYTGHGVRGTARGVTLLVTHRLSSVQLADLVVVLHQGRIAEVGTQQELLARGGLFAELFNLQTSAYRSGESC